MPCERLLLYFHTVRYLKVKQIYWQVYYRIFRRYVKRKALREPSAVEIRQWPTTWKAPGWSASCIDENGVFDFLGERGSVELAEDWNHPRKSKLWLYNLHYMDDLVASSDSKGAEYHKYLVSRWIDENPPVFGNGWEPYTLSLRLVNLVKWLSGNKRGKPEEIPFEWRSSIAQQAQALTAQIEHHIQANHLFANGKALVFAGAFLKGQSACKFLEVGLEILDSEVSEQFLDDGAHFELSPMYHSTLLWDLADLIYLAKCSALPELLSRVDYWRRRLSRGIQWLSMMTHPDGKISFFNDTAFNIAPSLEDIRRYTEFIGLTVDSSNIHAVELADELLLKVEHAACSGYVAVTWPQDCKALLDIAPVGPDYQPGHAHADTLSFELSLFGQRAIVNSGTSLYGESADRYHQRSTFAHNTVEVDGLNSTEVWSSFRVARRARCKLLSLESSDNSVRVCGEHSGYRRLRGNVIHRRQWCALPQALTIQDSLFGNFSQAIARYHFHPDISIILFSDCRGEFFLSNNVCVSFTIEGGSASSEASTWHPEFGLSLPNQCLEIRFNSSFCSVTFEWR